MNDLTSCLDDDSVAVKAPKPWHKLNFMPSKHIFPISLPSQLFCQHSNSLPLDKGRKSEGQTGACHSMPFSTTSPVALTISKFHNYFHNDKFLKLFLVHLVLLVL
jgi:hypothetical protein